MRSPVLQLTLRCTPLPTMQRLKGLSLALVALSCLLCAAVAVGDEPAGNRVPIASGSSNPNALAFPPLDVAPRPCVVGTCLVEGEEKPSLRNSVREGPSEGLKSRRDLPCVLPYHLFTKRPSYALLAPFKGLNPSFLLETLTNHVIRSYTVTLSPPFRGEKAPSKDNHHDTQLLARASAAGSYSFTPQAGWDNATFATNFCAGASLPSAAVVLIMEAKTAPFLLPDCFFNYGQFTAITLSNIIIVGNSSFLDPLDRLATSTASSSLTRISLTDSFLQTYSSDSLQYTPGWTTFFNTFPLLSSLTMLNCSLTGSLPATIPATLLTLVLSQNQLAGTVPSTLFNNFSSTSLAGGTLSVYLDYNELIGNLPAPLLATLPANSTVLLVLMNNNLVGTIPLRFLTINQASTIVGLTIVLDSNSIIDTLPSDLWGLPTTMDSLTTLTISASSLLISGTIPSTWLSQYSFPALTHFSLTMNTCQLSGKLHSGLIPASLPSISFFAIVMSNNLLNAPIDPSLLSTVLSLPISTSQFTFTASSSGINGTLTLPTPPTNSTTSPRIRLYLDSNSISSLNVEAYAVKYLTYLDVSYNSALQGSLNNLFSSSTSILTNLDVRNTSLTGTMPYMALMNTTALTTLSMDGVAIDFCSGSNRTLWNATSVLRSCSLLRTSANDCSSLYPSSCAISAPVAPVASVVPTPIAPTCSNATKPGDQFYCVNGVWTSNTTVTTPVLTIPSGASQTIVSGDVESSSIVFAGLGSTLTINGCASNLTSVSLTLTSDDLKGNSKIVQQLIVLASSDCTDDVLSTVTLVTQVSGSTCRKVKASKSVSNGQLSGIFTIDSSPCNRWWIILVSVICGLIVIGLVIFVLLVIFVPKVRYAVRPYSRPKQRGTL